MDSQDILIAFRGLTYPFNFDGGWSWGLGDTEAHLMFQTMFRQKSHGQQNQLLVSQLISHENLKRKKTTV
jgi:hypothetical protein